MLIFKIFITIKLFKKLNPQSKLNLHFHILAMTVKYQKKVMRILNSTKMVSKNNRTYFNVLGETVNTEPDDTEVTQLVAFEEYKLKVR